MALGSQLTLAAERYSICCLVAITATGMQTFKVFASTYTGLTPNASMLQWQISR